MGDYKTEYAQITVQIPNNSTWTCAYKVGNLLRLDEDSQNMLVKKSLEAALRFINERIEIRYNKKYLR